MQKEAELHAAEDRRRREEIEARNKADSMAYQAEKTLREQATRSPPTSTAEVEGKIAALRSALQAGTVDQIRSALTELSESLQKIGAAVYGQAGPEMAPPGAEGEGGEPSPPEEGTVEGEFREV